MLEILPHKKLHMVCLRESGVVAFKTSILTEMIGYVIHAIGRAAVLKIYELYPIIYSTVSPLHRKLIRFRTSVRLTSSTSSTDNILLDLSVFREDCSIEFRRFSLTGGYSSLHSGSLADRSAERSA